MTLSALAWTPPAGAVRDAELEAWEVSDRDASGVRHGDSTLYRDDGSVLSRCRYEGGTRSGRFTSYHPNGELESEGTYVNGELDGTFRRYTSESPGSAPLRSCCVPPGARELRMTYARGTSYGETFLDGSGCALRSDGTPLPERPPSVPQGAMFEEADEHWVHRFAGEDGSAFRRSYAQDGVLFEETESRGANRMALREFSPDGALAREHRFDESGLLHGPSVVRYTAETTPYDDRAIVEARGAYEHGQAVGVWRYLDGTGHELRAQDRGAALPDEPLDALLAPDALDAAALSERAARLAGDGRTREALVVAARAAARAGSAETLAAFLQERVVPLERDAARARVEAFDRTERPGVQGALDVLLAGGHPSECFRSLATLVPSHSALALELAEAAFLLADDPTRARVTRALLRLEQGDDQGALADAELLGAEFGEVTESIRELARILFPTFGFGPALDPPPEPDAPLAPVAVEQPLEAVRQAVALYATRLAAVRAELVRRVGSDKAWLPPETSRLFGAQPSELRRFTATITDEGEDGSEESEVEIDETLELERVSPAALMVTARADWDALCWLCWAAGLDTVALPDALSPRPRFASAVNDVMQRCFRACDQVRTGGLVSRSRGLASFSWEGLPVDHLSGRFAEIAARQYTERRALLLYLLFPENVSPFQSDLRKV